MGGGQEGRRREGGPPSHPLSSPRPPGSILRHRPSSCGPPLPPLQVTATAPHLRPFPDSQPVPLYPQPGPPSCPPSDRGQLWGGGGGGVWAVTAPGAWAGAGSVEALGVGGEAVGYPALMTWAPPHFPGEAGGQRCEGGAEGCPRPSGTVRVWGAPALAPPVSAQLHTLRSALPASQPRDVGRGRPLGWGWQRGYITRGARCQCVWVGGRGLSAALPALGPPVRVGWGEGEDAPASPGSPSSSTHPAAGAQKRRRWWGGWGCAGGRWVTCLSVFLIVVGF